jgi:hypothetical protein
MALLFYGEGFWLCGFWHRRSHLVNLESRLAELVFLLLRCGHVGNALALSKRSGMSTAPLAQAFRPGLRVRRRLSPVEVNPVGAMDQAVEDGVGVGGGRRSVRAIDRPGAGW